VLRTTVGVVVSTLDADAAYAAYRGVGPPDPLTAAPYWVVYGGMGQTDGPVAAPWADLSPEVQVTSVGKTAEQAEWMADRAFTLLIGPALSSPSGRAWARPLAPVGHVLTRPVERDDDFGPSTPLFYVAAIYDLPTTPA
jgi:hypothetical protein